MPDNPNVLNVTATPDVTLGPILKPVKTPAVTGKAAVTAGGAGVTRKAKKRKVKSNA